MLDRGFTEIKKWIRKIFSERKFSNVLNFHFRFALMEIKIALTRLLKMFTIKDCEKTQVPVPVNTANVQSPSEGVYVKLVPRYQ